MASAKTQPARGMRDFLPADVRRRQYVIGIIKEVYERYGFEPLETPSVENIETLMGKYGEEGNQLIFKILKRGVHESSGAADLALRYDLTVPLARVVAEYKDKLPKFFKRYQIQPVWRADRPARGRFREFYQCDVDVLGSKSLVVEAEICAAASDALSRLGFAEFTIRLNHRQVLTGLLKAFGVPHDKQAEALVTIDKREKIGDAGVVAELKLRGISQDAALETLSFFSRVNEAEEVYRQLISAAAGALGPEAVTQEIVPSVNEQISEGLLNLLREWLSADDVAQQGLAELESIIKLTKANGAGSRIRIDPGLARGLSYYTGAIMEISVEGIGSLGGGGRYDNLVGMFLGDDVPACGFSLGLERIIVVMTERDMFPPDLVSSPADIMVTIWNEESIAESLALAAQLRAQGLRVDVYPEAHKIGKQIKYAASRNISFVLVLGEEERASGEVTIQDMNSHERRRVNRDEVGPALRDALARIGHESGPDYA